MFKLNKTKKTAVKAIGRYGKAGGMQMYRYIGCENLFRSGEGRLYALELESPFLYETWDEAQRDNTSCRFKKVAGEVKLLVYSTTWAIIEERKGIGKVMRTVPSGKIIAEYTTDEFFQVPRNRIKRYVPAEERTSDEEFAEEYISFDDLFPDLEEGSIVAVSRSSRHRIAGDNDDE